MSSTIQFQLPCEQGRSIAIDPARTALACIDFQVDFVAPDGMGASRGLAVERLAAALPAAQRALAAARRAGVFVFHTREAYAPDLSDLNMYRRRFDSSIGTMGPLGRFLVRGERGTEILDSMKPQTGEPTIDKAGFNAFHNTALDTVLRVRGIETLLVMGFTTQCCVASTFRGGVDTGYCCVLLQDACAAFDPADHEATVRMTYSENHNFGWVSDSLRLETTLAAYPHP
ncbi:cysteine hydrolase family protein [Pelomonas sp. KK5]|uniref:cysteine hydrolase family protein n=1 Tax=Pelomonas sp. KK5 TaxID=1855730 RepID=UPI00097C16A8|nr:cysteine hydrolase [Pelomonas sp. KK5]